MWRLLVSLAVAALVCGFLCLCIAKPETDDDYSIAFFLSGLLPGQGLCLFINALLSKLIFWLNGLWPTVSWFFVAERLSAFIAFWALVYTTLTYVRPTAGLIAIAFVARFVLPNCICTSNFTFVAGLTSAVGVLMLSARIGSERAGKGSLVVGVLLLVLGLLWREQMFLAAMPFLAIAVAGKVFGVRFDRETLVSSVRMLLVVVVCCAAVIAVDRLEWSRDGWSEWRAYNNVRSVLSDYPMPTWDEASESLTEMGVSENDYRLIRNFATGDTDVLTLEKLRQVESLRTERAINLTRLVESTKGYLHEVASRPKYFAFLLFALVLLFAHAPRSGVFGLASYGVAFAMCVYFLLLERLLPRVETTVWCYALASATALYAQLQRPEEDEAAEPVALYRLAVFALAVLVGLYGTMVPLYRRRGAAKVENIHLALHQDEYQATGPLSTYIKEHPDSHYVLAVLPYYFLEGEYKYYYQPDADVAMRALMLGGWGIGSPCRNEQVRLAGASNVMDALANVDNTYLIADEEMANRILVFLQEHYDAKIEMEHVDSVRPRADVWSFSR